MNNNPTLEALEAAYRRHSEEVERLAAVPHSAMPVRRAWHTQSLRWRSAAAAIVATVVAAVILLIPTCPLAASAGADSDMCSMFIDSILQQQ